MSHEYINVHTKSRLQILLLKNCKLHNTKVLFSIIRLITTNVSMPINGQLLKLVPYTISFSVQKHPSSTCSNSQTTLVKLIKEKEKELHQVKTLLYTIERLG